jgi:hypothetical protein
LSESTKGGNVILRRVSVPDHVDPGEAFEVDVKVEVGGAYVDPWDPDKCGPAEDGYRIEVVLDTDAGRLTKGPTCQLITEIGETEQIYTFSAMAPISGRAEVEAHLRLPGSGKQTDSVEASALVTDEPPEEANDPGNGNSNDENGDPNNGNNPLNDLFGGSLGQLKWVVVLALIAWVLSSTSDISEAVA